MPGARQTTCAAVIMGALLSACDRGASTSPVPAGQEAVVAKIALDAPAIAPPRRGGFLAPAETGRQIRAQAVRPPTPGALVNPPPPG